MTCDARVNEPISVDRSCGNNPYAMYPKAPTTIESANPMVHGTVIPSSRAKAYPAQAATPKPAQRRLREAMPPIIGQALAPSIDAFRRTRKGVVTKTPKPAPQATPDSPKYCPNPRPKATVISPASTTTSG